MKRYGLRSKVHPVLGIAAIALGVIGALVSAAPKVDLQRVPEDWEGIAHWLAWVAGASWWLTPMIVMTIGIIAFFRNFIGEPWIYDAIHSQLNGLRDHVFAAERGEPKDHHRVTLFRYQSWWQYPCFLSRPFVDKLVPVERSGHLQQETRTTFCVSKDAQKVEGVAGRAWRTFSSVKICDLPELKSGSLSSTVEEYCKLTWTDKDWVKERLKANKMVARSFYAIPIRVKGREWGVVILDSMNEGAVARTPDETYQLVAQSLQKLLERV